MISNKQIFQAARSLTLLIAALVMPISLTGVPNIRAAQPLKFKPATIEPETDFTRSRAYGINNSGQVAGHFYNWDGSSGTAVDRQAFVWDKTNGATTLPTLSGETTAWGINDNGYVSGESFNASGHRRAVRWDASGPTIVDIEALTNTNPDPDVSGNLSSGYDINNQNKVVGQADIPNDDESFTPFHDFVYDDTNGIQDLGTFTNAYPQWQNGYSIAYDINNNDVVVGCAQDGNWTLLPFVWDTTNGLQELNRNAGYSETTQEWYAVAINDAALIGGHVIVAENQSLPHYWPNAGVDPVQISMPDAFPYGEIYGINAQGQLVGIMWDTDQTGATEHAFIFDVTNGVQDLNDLIKAGSGWVLNVARDINDKGQIVGFGDLNGQTRGFFLDSGNGMNPAVNMLLLDE